MNGHHATCDPADIAHLQAELIGNPNNLGVGVIDLRTGQVRVIPYDDTDLFARMNLALQVMAGHEAAAAMVGIPTVHARGFALGLQGGDWHVFNQSHLNRPDGQANPMQMNPLTFADILQALEDVGVTDVTIH